MTSVDVRQNTLPGKSRLAAEKAVWLRMGDVIRFLRRLPRNKKWPFIGLRPFEVADDDIFVARNKSKHSNVVTYEYTFRRHWSAVRDLENPH